MNVFAHFGSRTTRVVGVFGLGIALMGPVALRADSTAFALDPARSTVTLSGSISALGLTVPLQEQGAQSLAPTYSGTFVVDRQGGTVQFVDGSQIIPLETGPWQPGVGGAAGQAPASYAAKATVSLGFFSANANAASRRVVFDVRSTPVPLQNGEFAAGLVGVKFLETANSTLDFRITGAVKTSGAKVLSGLLTNQVGQIGTIAVVEGVETVTIPIDATYGFDLTSPVGPVTFTMNFKGQLVATKTAAPEQPVVGLSLPTAPGEPLKLLWSPSYKLQRATTLLPPNWADFATDSPVTIPTVQAGEYFQVVHK